LRSARQIRLAGARIAWRATPARLTAAFLGRVDAKQPHPFSTATQGIAIHDPAGTDGHLAGRR
jgi:hypothetical protein